MRTTIDLPDDLFRQIKARAALRGMKLKEYVTAALRDSLVEPPPGELRERTAECTSETTRLAKDCVLPLIAGETTETLRSISEQEIDRILASDELEVRHLLADVNVWLATLVAEHPHHRAAIRWWKESLLPAGDRITFCRLTQLGLLRLLCNEDVMGPQRKTVEEAWSVYRELRIDRRVVFSPEPEGTEALLAQHCRLGGSSAKFWTDGYLAAFARAGDLGLVTFDRDFTRFPALDLTLLETR